MSFADFGLAEPIARAVSAAGYETPTPIQAGTIEAAMAGKDVLGLAQTGTGKTAAFALPVLHRLLTNRPPQPVEAPRAPERAPQGRGDRYGRNDRRQVSRPVRCLILAPTRELVVQIAESFDKYRGEARLGIAVIVGGVGYQPQIRALQRGVDVLVATPGRLEDLLSQGHGDLSQVEFVVLDEADRMFDVGFLPAVRRLLQVTPKERQTLLFSATMPDEVRSLADSVLNEPVLVHVKPVAETTALIDQSVCFVNKPQKIRLLLTLLQNNPVERAIVFTRTKHTADRVAEALDNSGIPAAALHGNKSQNARQRTLADFRSTRPPVLVATDLAARGLDVPGVSHVFNFDLPREPETYVHRIGRTGRAGATGHAISFCDDSERRQLQLIERQIKRRVPINPTRATANAPLFSERTPDRGAAQEHQRRPPRSNDGPGSRGPRGPRPPRPGMSYERPGMVYERPAGGEDRRPAHGEPQASAPAQGERQAPPQGERRPYQQGGRRPYGQGQGDRQPVPQSQRRPYQGEQRAHGPSQGERAPVPQGERPPLLISERPPLPTGERPAMPQGERRPYQGERRPPAPRSPQDGSLTEGVFNGNRGPRAPHRRRRPEGQQGGPGRSGGRPAFTGKPAE